MSKKKLVEDFGYKTLASELYIDHWNAKLAEVDDLEFSLPTVESRSSATLTGRVLLDMDAINESVAYVTGGTIGMVSAATVAEIPNENPPSEEKETEDDLDDDKWMESKQAFLSKVRANLGESKT